MINFYLIELDQEVTFLQVHEYCIAIYSLDLSNVHLKTNVMEHNQTFLSHFSPSMSSPVGVHFVACTCVSIVQEYRVDVGSTEKVSATSKTSVGRTSDKFIN